MSFVGNNRHTIVSVLFHLCLGLFLLAACFSFFERAEANETVIPEKAYKYRAFLIQESRVVWGLNAPSSTFAAQIHTESLWNEKAKSFVGAMGLTQFMPQTADWIGSVYAELKNGSPYNPTWAIRALIRYNKWHYDKIRAADSGNKMAFALSAYNGGLGWVLRDKKKAQALGMNPDFYFDSVEKVNAGRNSRAWNENRSYVELIRKREGAYLQKGWGYGAFTE